MMLRVSSEVEGNAANLASVIEGDATDSAVPAGDVLLRFAEVSLGDDAQEIAQARAAVSEALGDAAMVDAAGIIANFQRMVRIADSSGIPLDTPVAMMTQDIRADLGLNDFGAAGNTPELGFIQKLLGRILGPFAWKILARRFKVADDADS